MKRRQILRLLEWGLLVSGLACLAIYGTGQLHARMTQERAGRAFAAVPSAPSALASSATASDERAGGRAPASASAECPSAADATTPGDEHAWRAQVRGIPIPDQSSWDPGRRRGHARAVAELDPDAALARLDIPSIDVSVLVLPGVDVLSLNGGVGHVPGTPGPGEPGNVGIAGHRDGFFRGLERIATGDALRLTTRTASFEYRVEWIKIVGPNAVEVLAGTDEDAITLVTCYPFRIIGQAPQRFIVRATCAGSGSRDADVAEASRTLTHDAGRALER